MNMVIHFAHDVHCALNNPPTDLIQRLERWFDGDYSMGSVLTFEHDGKKYKLNRDYICMMVVG